MGRLPTHFLTNAKFVFIIDFSDFVPPSLKGKGDRGKGSIARNLPTIATRIQRRRKVSPSLDRNRMKAYNAGNATGKRLPNLRKGIAL